MSRIARKESKLSIKEVAAAVKRTVTVKGGKAEAAPIKEADVLDWAEYPNTGRLVVITTAGERLEGDLPAAKK